MPQTYTAREYAEMHLIYGFCRGNARQAVLTYRERYPNRESYPDHRVFIRVHNTYLEGRIPGSVVPEGKPRRIDDRQVLNEVEEDPSTSVRRISQRTGVAKSTVHRILRDRAKSTVKHESVVRAHGRQRERHQQRHQQRLQHRPGQRAPQQRQQQPQQQQQQRQQQQRGGATERVAARA